MTVYGDLLGPQPTRLEVNQEPRMLLEKGADPATVARDFPDSSLAWAYLARQADAQGDVIASYAYSRTGYHRGIDQLRRAGWKGFGPVPYRHEDNQGWLQCVAALSVAAEKIGEEEEYLRCLDLIHECDPSPETSEALGLHTKNT